MVGTWLMQQKICETRSWIIRKSDHWPVLQALRWRGMDGAFSGGTNSGQKSLESKQNSASLKGFEPVGDTNKEIHQTNSVIAISFSNTL